MSCFVRQSEGRAFSDPLIGLKISEEGVARLCPEAFSCCGTSHSRIDTGGNLYVCDVGRRLRKVQAILNLHQDVWDVPFQGHSLRAHPMLTQFFTYCCQSGSVPLRGQVFQSKTSGDSASPLIWLMAIVAVWRFSSEVHVITLGKTKADKLLPRPGNLKSHERPLVFVDQKEPLRLPHVEFDFDLVVNWCEGSMAPLWMDVLTEGEQSPKVLLTGSAEEQFRRRIERFRNSPPLSWIYADTCSRLCNVSFGSELYS